MTLRYRQVMFTPNVADVQARLGSRTGRARLDEPKFVNDELTAREEAFIAERDSFYLATVSETGWPYVQHRGGSKGLLRMLSSTRLGFADFAGNRQYVSVGNLRGNARVALFLMDYANRRRLKIIGVARVLEDDEAIARVGDGTGRARVERAIEIDVTAYDWNCSQHIVPRFSEAELLQRVGASAGTPSIPIKRSSA